jgi:hypothetical protein
MPPASTAPTPVTASGATPAAAVPRRTGNPLIKPGLAPALCTTVLAALLAGAAPLGRWPLAAAVVVLQVFTAAGWFRLNGMWPARQGIALAFLAGLATDAGLLFAEPGHAVRVLIGTLGAWCLLTLALHLRNTSAPDERLYALTAGFTATLLTVVAAGHLLALPAAGPQALVAGFAAVAAATLVRALPLPSYVSPVLALAAGAGAGAWSAQLLGLGRLAGAGAPLPVVAAGAVLGLAAALCAVAGLRVASYDWPSRFVHFTAGLALPLTLAAPALWLAGRLLG